MFLNCHFYQFGFATDNWQWPLKSLPPEMPVPCIIITSLLFHMIEAFGRLLFSSFSRFWARAPPRLVGSRRVPTPKGGCSSLSRSLTFILRGCCCSAGSFEAKARGRAVNGLCFRVPHISRVQETSEAAAFTWRLGWGRGWSLRRPPTCTTTTTYATSSFHHSMYLLHYS